MSKWMDATMHAAVFHLQSKHYDKVRPPSFFNHDDLNKLNLTRERKRHCNGRQTIFTQRQLKSVVDCEKNIFEGESLVRAPGFVRVLDESAPNRSPGGVNGGSNGVESPRHRTSFALPSKRANSPHNRLSRAPISADRCTLPNSVLDGFWDIIPPTPDIVSNEMLERTQLNAEYFPSSQCPNQNFAHRPDNATPPLFLQELAHLTSLACAVALSTLRNDVEGSESVLDMYVPGSPWPPIDPDRLPAHVRRMFQHRFRACTILRHWIGNDRLPKWRSHYNAARPLLILGGVSDGEIKFLQRARGAQAKVHLAMGWLKEFIIREHLDGSLGDVHAAIISRLVQFLSDGMVHYHIARKVMYIPFPFPHAQLSAFFTVIMVLAVPFLMDQYTNEVWIGSLVSFLTVTCLVGLHEVARELENPFRNVPNELPLCTLQARFNETLVTMFSGFNPDSFWDAEMYQGPLEAMKLGKIYQSFGEQKMEESAVETILEMPTLAESMGQDATITKRSTADRTTRGSAMKHQNNPEKGKNVSFSAKVQTNNDVAKELREVLAKQKLEIEELEKILDRNASTQESNVIGAVESWISQSFSERKDDKE